MTRLIIILLTATTLTGCFSTKFVSSTSPKRVLHNIPKKSKLIIYMDDLTTISGKINGINDSYVYVERILRELDSIPLERIIGVETRGIEAFLTPSRIIKYLDLETKIVVRTWNSQEYKGILVNKNKNHLMIKSYILGDEIYTIPLAAINSITARFSQAHIIKSKSPIPSLLHRLKSFDRIRVRFFDGGIMGGRIMGGKVRSMSQNQIKFSNGNIVNIDTIATIKHLEWEIDKATALMIIAMGLAF